MTTTNQNDIEEQYFAAVQLHQLSVSAWHLLFDKTTEPLSIKLPGIPELSCCRLLSP
jgi:hypothetical protein